MRITEEWRKNMKKNNVTKSSKQPQSLKHPKYPQWEITQYAHPKMQKPILIEGMPGIGNVGKISMDILIEGTHAQLFMTFFSHQLPSSVFVNHHNLIELPKLCLYYKKIGTQHFLFLTGDVQPISEQSSYEFSEIIAEQFKNLEGSHIVTLGGIGLGSIPEQPRIYLTGNDKHFVDAISKAMQKNKVPHERTIYGLVGPILGVSGLLLGIAQKYGIKAYSLLAETFGHPVYIGLDSARVILTALNKIHHFHLTFEKLDKEILEMQARMQGITPGEAGTDENTLKYRAYSDVNYIG
jgi:proteasome assembly chaperone (PAC2) family protein